MVCHAGPPSCLLQGFLINGNGSWYPGRKKYSENNICGLLEANLEHNSPNDSVSAKLPELPSLENELSFWLLWGEAIKPHWKLWVTSSKTLENLWTLCDWQKFGLCFRFMPNIILVWFSLSFLRRTLQLLGSSDCIYTDIEVQEKRSFWRLGRGSMTKCVRWMLWFSLLLARLYYMLKWKK